MVWNTVSHTKQLSFSPIAYMIEGENLIMFAPYKGET